MTEKVIKRLALELAEKRLHNRKLRTEVLYTLIAKYVEANIALRPRERKKIIDEAVKHYRVDVRTAERAIKRHRVGKRHRIGN
jgi:hypothetical protein